MVTKRLNYIDVIKLILIILVYSHHAVIAFSHNGGWFYYSHQQFSELGVKITTVQTTVEQAFLMGLFFFLSAYFTPRSIDKKGVRLFLKDRFNRLAIPLLIYYFLFNPIIVYSLYGVWENGLGVMWFVLTLLVFELLYLPLHSLFNRSLKEKKFKWRSSYFILFFVFMGTITFLLRLLTPVGYDWLGLQPAFYPLYVGMYFAGIMAYHYHWLEHLPLAMLRWWVPIALFSIALMACLIFLNYDKVPLALGGNNLFALFYAFWEPVACVAISAILLIWGQTYWNTSHAFLSFLSRNNYAFYIMHSFVVVACTLFIERFSPSAW